MTDYKLLNSQLQLTLADETDGLANAANFVAQLYNGLADINWLGLYISRASGLVLGPFQGLPAVTTIAMGDGVCGAAAEQRQTLRVPDVHAFPGHIACDAASRSEIVVPLIKEDRLLGVLDIDSPVLDRFSVDDQRGIEALCGTYLDSVDSHYI
ncbi:MAG: GAF domain-containing protein [Woeseiaceae bacterium]|nr:GAF domain-containing protein [Woeseiaceae bacterium]